MVICFQMLTVSKCLFTDSHKVRPFIFSFSHSQPRALRPPHPFSNGTGQSERGGSLPPRDSQNVNKYTTRDSQNENKYMPSGFAQQDSDQISKPFSNNGSQSKPMSAAPSPPQRKCYLSLPTAMVNVQTPETCEKV